MYRYTTIHYPASEVRVRVNSLVCVWRLSLVEIPDSVTERNISSFTLSIRQNLKYKLEKKIKATFYLKGMKTLILSSCRVTLFFVVYFLFIYIYTICQYIVDGIYWYMVVVGGPLEDYDIPLPAERGTLPPGIDDDGNTNQYLYANVNE